MARVVARAEGFGPAWMEVGQFQQDAPLKLRLVDDRVPIEGRILDLEGQPVVAANVSIQAIYGYANDRNLDEYLELTRDNPLDQWEFLGGQMSRIPAELAFAGAPEQAASEDRSRLTFQTDAEGRFVLRGIGRERVANVTVDGPNIERLNFSVVTRSEIAEQWRRTDLSDAVRERLDNGMSLPLVYPARFEHLAGPDQAIRGTVYDQQAGQPLVGAEVVANLRGADSWARATTDEQGRYELRGLRPTGQIKFSVSGPAEQPYLQVERGPLKLSATTPLTSEETDFRLTRGAFVRGRLLDGASGTPVKGRVEYIVFADNPYLGEMAEALGMSPSAQSVAGEDGEFQVIALPGPGVVVANAVSDRFLVPSASDFGRPTNKRGWIATANRGWVRPDDFHVATQVNVPPDAQTITLNLELRAGQQVSGTLVDREGQPVAGAEAEPLHAQSASFERLDTPEFAVSGISEMRTVYFRHRARKLGAALVASGGPGPTHPTPNATMRDCDWPDRRFKRQTAERNWFGHRRRRSSATTRSLPSRTCRRTNVAWRPVSVWHADPQLPVGVARRPTRSSRGNRAGSIQTQSG